MAMLTRWRRLRFRIWTIRLRLRLRRQGCRLVLAADRTAELREAPRLHITPDGEGDATLHLRIGRGVTIEPGVSLRVAARATNELDLGDRATLQEGVRIWLMGGTIRIGEGTIVRDQSVLKSGGLLTVGETVRIGYSSVVHCHERVELAARSVIADLVVIVDSDHVHDGSETWVMAQPVVSAPIRVGSNTLVAAHAIVTRGAVIGSNAVVASGAVVRAGEHPDGWLIGGIPAEPLREL
jgi:acetyltransferase-like isoleucine patch superfamily enzyme